MSINLNNERSFTDYLNSQEVEFCKQVIKIFIENKDKWSNLLNDKKIKRAINVKKGSERTAQDDLQIKSSLFEIRVAYALGKLKAPIKYEYSAGIGASTVDFLLETSPSWLIELTSLHESLQIKQHTQKFGDRISAFIQHNDSEGDNEILRAVRAIISKVSNKKGEPAKFPKPTENLYNMIIIDMRSSNMGSSDHKDFYTIAYGEADSEIYRGVFNSNKLVRKRIHALGFISEKNYKDNEIIDTIEIFGNPNLYSSKEEFENSIPDMLKNNLFLND